MPFTHVLKYPFASAVRLISPGISAMTKETEEAFGAQTLNRTPSCATVAPKSRAHDLLGLPLFFATNLPFPVDSSADISVVHR